MLLLPWDSLFLAGFVYSGYRTVGRWFKYTDNTAKAQSDAGYIEGFREFLAEAAAAGDRSKAGPGAAADSSGQGHLWREWAGLKTKQKLALLEEMHKVLEWTGQDAAYRVLKRYRGVAWSQLPHKAKKELLVAADKLDWDFIKEMEQEGFVLGNNSRLWQLNEPVPALSLEPALAESLLEEAKGLQGLVTSADTAVSNLLTSQQEAVIAALKPANELRVTEAKRKLDLLREAAQGGLGLGSGGKAARGQQLLELLRGISLIPSDTAAQEAKAAAAAALDEAADQAVSGLKDQHAAALAAAVAAARVQATVTALGKQIRPSSGKGSLTAATAAAIVSLAAEEIESGIKDLQSAAPDASLATKRVSGEQVMSMCSLMDSVAAALAAAAADEDEEAEKTSELCQAVDSLMSEADEFVVKKARSKAKDDESAAAETTDAAAPVQKELQAVQAAVAALQQQQPAAAVEDNESSEGGAVGSSADSIREAVRKEVEEAVALVEERTKASQETALQNARSRERMSALLAKAKQLMTTPAAAAAAADSADSSPPADESTSASDSSPAMEPAEKLAVTEEYLKQLGTRPLTAALQDLNKLVVAAGSDQGAEGLASGLTLESSSLKSLKQLGELLAEIDLADSIMSLDLGPKVTDVLQSLTRYMERVKAKHQEEEEKRAAGVEEEEDADSEYLLVNPVVPAGTDAASTPKTLGVSPNQVKEAEAVEKCSTLVSELQSDGLVVLGLTAGQYRQLAQLKEAVAALAVGMDALKYDRCVTALKDVAGQLGPIGAAIQVKLADTTDESLRAIMQQQKTLAVDLYQNLQAFLSFEDNVRGPLKKSLRELASLAGGIGAPRNTSGCEAAALKLEMAQEEAQKLQDALGHLATSSSSSSDAAASTVAAAAGPSADDVTAGQQIVETLEASIEALQSQLSTLAAHVALRARALNPEVAAAAAAAGVEGTDLDLSSLEDLTPELDHPLHILGNASEDQQAAWEHLGFEQIARGRVATILIATAAADATAAASAGAADGTPRVALPVPGLPSGKSVLQLTAERILRLQQLAATSTFGKNAPVSQQTHWYIMTSPATHDKLAQILKQHNYFGLQPNQIHLFNCKTAPPAFSGEPLKALTLGSATLSRGSPGSGEVFATLKCSGALGHMNRSGIRHVEINATDDNILARPADPMFIGFCIDSRLDASAKVVEPESVAPVYAAATADSPAAAEGEEADATRDLAESIRSLAPACGSYYFTFAALKKAAMYYDQHPLAMYRLVPNAKLPSKAAAPAMTVNLPPNATQAQRMQAQQALVAAQHAAAAAPAKPVEGYVPTRLISDIFCTADDGPLAGASLAYLGVDKEEEFSAVFGSGPHLVVPEPELAAGDLLALTTGWVENQGAVVECEEGVEVSPLVSYAGEGLEVVAGEGRVFSEPYDLTLQGASSEGRAKLNAGPWAVPVLVAYAVGAGLAVAKQAAGAR